MGYFKDILKYEKKYRKFTVLNVVFNILYAIFNVLSVLAFIPVLGILFETEKKVVTAPVYKSIGSIGTYLKDSFYIIGKVTKNKSIKLISEKGYDVEINGYKHF